MGTSSARRRSFGRGVRKFRIISQALQLQVRISLARRRSFRRVGEFTHFFVDGNDKQNGKYGSDGGIGREEVLPFQGTVLEPRHHVHILWHFRSLGKGMHEFLEWFQSELSKNVCISSIVYCLQPVEQCGVETFGGEANWYLCRLAQESLNR